MSRIANKPVEIPNSVELNLNGQLVNAKGNKGLQEYLVHPLVTITLQDQLLMFAPVNDSIQANAIAGTTRVLVSNMLLGVRQGFEKKLELVGVGYRAQAQGKKLNLTLGYSHPISFDVPEGITIETPTQTEILIKGMDKQIVGEVAAVIRRYRPPECYKGKGIRYAGEKIALKETKKK